MKTIALTILLFIFFTSCEKDVQYTYYNYGDIALLISAEQPFYVDELYTTDKSIKYLFWHKKTGDEIILKLQLDTNKLSTLTGKIEVKKLIKSQLKIDSVCLIGSESYILRLVLK